MSAQRQRLSALAQLVGMAAALGAFDDYEPPAVVPADPEHPGPVGEHCCWANYMISPTTHNADCPTRYGEQREEEERRWSAEQEAERAAKGGA